MTLVDFAQFMANIASSQDLIVKILLAIFLSLYILFALILMIQIRRFTAILDQVSFSPIIKTFSSAHLIASLLLLFGTIIFL